MPIFDQQPASRMQIKSPASNVWVEGEVARDPSAPPLPSATPPAALLTKRAAQEMVAKSGLDVDDFAAALKAGQVTGAEQSTSGVRSWTIPEPSVLAWIDANGGDVDAAKEP